MRGGAKCLERHKCPIHSRTEGEKKNLRNVKNCCKNNRIIARSNPLCAELLLGLGGQMRNCWNQKSNFLDIVKMYIFFFQSGITGCIFWC